MHFEIHVSFNDDCIDQNITLSVKSINVTFRLIFLMFQSKKLIPCSYPIVITAKPCSTNNKMHYTCETAQVAKQKIAVLLVT